MAACAGGVLGGRGRITVRWAGWRRSKSIPSKGLWKRRCLFGSGRGGCGSYLKEKAEQVCPGHSEADPGSAELGLTRKAGWDSSTERSSSTSAV